MTLLKEAWVHTDVVNARLVNGMPDPTVYSVQGTIFDNEGYGLTKKGIEQFAKTLTEDEKQARLHGIPSYMAGLVLPQFKRDKHVIERFTVPLDWPITIAIDVHPRERQAALFLATDPKGERFAVDEIWEYGSGKELAEMIIRRVSQRNYRVIKAIIDPLAKSDTNNPMSTYEQIRLVLGRFDIPLRVGEKDKDSGILLIKEHLEGPNNQPSLFFFRDLVRTIFEIEGWLYDKDQKAKKENDHMCENLYRLLLLNTKYYPPEDDDDGESVVASRSSLGANRITGY
jgi:hypothetical protein